MVEQYQAQHDLRPGSSITVLLTRTFRGKVRRGACRERQLRLCDVLPLAKLSLEASLFVNMKQTFQQARGSAIGNQVSPILANLAVSVLEVDWRRRYPVQRFSSRLFTTRYVDNRLTLADEHLLDFSFLSIFSDLAFYQPPVQPECVPGDEGDQFLGFHTHPASRKLVFVQPQEDFQIRPFLAAGTVANKYAPVQSRMAGIPFHLLKLKKILYIWHALTLTEASLKLK